MPDLPSTASPAPASALRDRALYARAVPHTTRICKPVLRIMRRRATALSVPSVHGSPISRELTQADVVDASARSALGRLFTEPLAMPFDGEAFRAFCCVLLSLPSPVAHSPLLEVDGFDYPVRRCPNEHPGCA